MMLTPRENLLRIFRHEGPEWIPVCAHVDPYNQPSREGMDSDLAAALGTVQWSDESTVRFSRYLGLDIMDFFGAPLRVQRRRVTIETAQENDDTIHIWRTPSATLREVSRRCRDDGTSYRVEHLVKTAADLPALAAILEDETWELDPQKMKALRRRQELIGRDGMIMASLPGTPMGMMYRVYSGVEPLIYLHTDARQALRDLFAVMEENYQQQYRLVAETGIDALIGMDDTSTTIISPAMFEEFNLALTDQRAEICHRRGKLYFHHSCGLIRDLLPLYRRTRMDAVHAFTVPPIGNVTVKHGRQLLGNQITIIAGVAPLADETWDLETMRAGVRQLCMDAQPGDHFVLCLVAYPHRTMAETRAVVEECRKYQRLTQNPRRSI
jgi:hypothetical protein